MDYASCIFHSESEFDNAVEEEISDENKAYIFGVITRLNRILNWNQNLVDENRLFNRSNGPQIIREFLSYYYEWKELVRDSDAVDARSIRHIIIFNVAKLALYYWIADSELVALILGEVFECDDHFSSMFSHVANRYDRRSLLGQSSVYSMQKDDEATVFFLHHAKQSRLEFNGIRFHDVPLQFPLEISPVFLAAIYKKPNLLLHLLRFGAQVESPSNRRRPDDWDVAMVLRHLIRILWNSLGDDLRSLHIQTYAVATNIIHQASECFRILLRAVPQIRLGEINFLLMKFEDGVLSRSVCSHEFIRRLADGGIVPTLVKRYLEPADLQHLCRCVIRNAMNRNYNLPYGIALLPLPVIVKNYLSLLMD